MDYFPIFVGLEDRTVLFVGDGEDIARKLRLVARTPARLKLVARTLPTEFADLVRQGRLDWSARNFEPTHLDGVTLVFCAADEATSETVARLARARSIPVNVVDRPDLSGFITPAIVDRDPVIIAIGTEGSGPLLAQGLRARIEALLPARLGEIARLANGYRALVGRVLAPGLSRRTFWRRFFFAGLGERLLETPEADVATALEAHLRQPATRRVTYIVADDAAPDLLTLKAVQRMQDADVILHAGDTAPAILDYCRRDAIRRRPGAAVDVAADAVVRLLRPGDEFDPSTAAEQDRFAAAGWHVEIIPHATANADGWAVLCDRQGNTDAIQASDWRLAS